MKIQSTDSIKENKIKAVVAGVSGAGKTFQLSKLKPAGFKPLCISAEAGLLSVAGTGVDFIDITKDDNGVVIPKEKRIDRLMDVYRFILTKEAMEKYDTIYIDSLTELSQCMFDFVKKEFPERKDSLVLYGELGQKMRDMIKAFRDCPHYHVIFTCLTKIEKDETGKRFMAFDMIGSISDKLPQFLDLVVYAYSKEDGEREFLCSGTDKVFAKDRSGKLDKVEKADLGLLMQKITGTNQENKNV